MDSYFNFLRKKMQNNNQSLVGSTTAWGLASLFLEIIRAFGLLFSKMLSLELLSINLLYVGEILRIHTYLKVYKPW